MRDSGARRLASDRAWGEEDTALRSLKDLDRHTATAADGDLGTLVNLLLDDLFRVVRHLVVEAGGFLEGRRVLLSPVFFRQAEWLARRFRLALTMDGIRSSPNVYSDAPVSRHHEQEFHRHYGYPAWLGGEGIRGMGAYPGSVTAGAWNAAPAGDLERASRDVHLRSAREARGCRAHRSDGEIGHVSGFLVDDESWRRRHLVVDTSSWRFGKEVLVAPDWATRFRWEQSKVHLDMSRQAVKDSPERDAPAAVDRGYELRLHDYYGRPAYRASGDRPTESHGDLIEGVTAEAASLAGDLRLGRLIVLYDANRITLSATTNVTSSEDVGVRFSAYGRPEDARFLVPEEARRGFDEVRARGAALRSGWLLLMDGYRAAHGDLAGALDRAVAGELPPGRDARLPVFTPGDGPMATRDAGGKVIAAPAESVPNLIGGAADLDPSTRTMMKGKGDLQSVEVPEAGQNPPTQGAAGGVWGYAGRNIHLGIREHAMTAILTGMAHHGGVVSFGATFFTFSDYMRPGIRLAALSAAHVIYVWTHDSIAVGEDGPAHRPVEQLAGLRAMPNLLLLRPADATEAVEAWRIALRHTAGPVGLLLSRKELPVLGRTLLAPADRTARGAYVLSDAGEGSPELILIATGSEVSLALEAHRKLAGEGIRSRVVSVPSRELFEAQAAEYRDAVLPPAVHARVSVVAGARFGWERYVGPGGAMIGVDRFGASAPGPDVMARYGFTVENAVATAKAALSR